MLNMIRSLFSNTLYIRLREDRLRVTSIETLAEYDETPWIAIETGKQRIVKAVGREAKQMRDQAGLEVTNPFSHPRLLVSRFETAEKLIQHGIRTVCNNKIIAPHLLVVMHPLEKLEGGITDLECRLYRELALGAGARKVFLHVDAELDVRNFNLANVNPPQSS